MTAKAQKRPDIALPLLLSTFALAIAGLVYELLAGTVSAYLLGSSVYQFSIVIGLFMSAMGIGAWLSRHIDDAENAFVTAQIALGLIGGGSALILFFAYIVIENYNAVLFLICVLAGTLVGLEIPLVTRILEGHGALRLNISNILTADYIGALAAAILFPLVLVPQLGLIQTGLLFGALNLLVAALAIHLFDRPRLWRFWAPAMAAMLLAIAGSSRFTTWLETRLFEAEIVYAETTPYQRLVVAKSGGHTQLFINGNLQFDTIDEHRYHEALVHPLMTLSPRIANILILGGGDGMALREVLRYDDVQTVTLVDLDPAMTRLFRDQSELAALNGQSFRDPRVTTINTDAWQFVETTETLFDAAIIDLPDPNSLSLSKLYSLDFYRLLTRKLSRDGMIVTQSTSPTFARAAFWSIHQTLKTAPAPFSLDEPLTVIPYHNYVPSFGDWGFNLAAGRMPAQTQRPLPQNLRFVNADFFDNAQIFAPDNGPIEVEVNTILEHALVGYYETGWRTWFGDADNRG